MATIERRSLPIELEYRTTADTITVEGYASVFSAPYDMGMYQEEIAPGAFRKTLSEAPDVRFLINHDGLPLARTTSGTLELSEDSTGLHMRAQLDPTDPDVASLLPKMRRGDLDQMSFAFRTIKDEWSSDYAMRTMRELSLRDGDVSVVTYPASPTTSISLRNARTKMAAAPLLARVIASLQEERAGAAISAANLDALQKILDAIAAADVELDQALVDLSGLMGVDNPDVLEMPDAEIPAEDMPEGMDPDMEEEAEESGIDIDIVIAIARARAAASATAGASSTKYLR